MKSRYQVGYGALFVDARFAITLSDNAEAADRKCWIKAAPAMGHHGLVAVYLATNGDPIQIATLDGTGAIVWYLGEYEHEDTDEITIADCLDTFADFAGLSPYKCAKLCAELFSSATE